MVLVGYVRRSLRLIAGFFQPQLLLLKGFESFPELVERARDVAIL